MKWTVRFIILTSHPISGDHKGIEAPDADSAIRKACDSVMRHYKLHPSDIRYGEWTAQREGQDDPTCRECGK